MKPLVKLEIKVPVEIFRGEVAWVSHCKVFDVASQGETEEEALDNLVDALKGFLLTCFEMGTLDKILKESGFTPAELSALNDSEPPDGLIVDIPLPFMIPDSNNQECHA